MVDEAKITSRGNDKLIDWTTIAEQHFPGADPFDLLYLYEHGDTDHSTDVRGSGKRTSASTAGSVKDVSAAKQQSAVFTKEQNARILEFFARHRSHSAHFTSAEIDTRALQEFVGTTKPRHVIIQHYHNLNYWRPWTPEDDARLLDAYNAGKPLVDVAAELERITANVRQRIDLLLRDDTEDAERGSKRLGKFGSIFVRRQFQVCGPDWGSLQLMTGVKT